MSIQNFSFRLPSVPKLICSIPVIIATLYFVPPIGVILTITRLFVFGSYRYYRVPTIILIIALLSLIPRAYELLQNNFGEAIPTIQPLIDFRNHQLFAKFTDYGRWTAIFGIIMLVISIIFGKLFNAISTYFSKVSTAATKYQKDTENTKKLPRNGDEINERYKEEVTKNKSETDQNTPHVAKCPSCGKVNHFIGTVGKCKACRNPIEWTPKTK